VVGAVLANPYVMLKDKYHQMRYFLQPDYPRSYVTDAVPETRELMAAGHTYAVAKEVVPSKRFSALRSIYSRWIINSSQGPFAQLLWAPGIALLGYAAAAVIAVRKRLTGSLLYVAFLLLSAAFVVVVSPASDYRYLYFLTVGVFVLPLLLAAEHRHRVHGDSPPCPVAE
jgi:hypothetical protein